MKKFPVTSPSGNQYLIKITPLRSNKWTCDVYKPIYIKGVKVWSKLVESANYNESFNNDFILIAERAVTDYENSYIEIENNKKKFKEWNGFL